MNLKECMEDLISEGYVTEYKNRYLFTAKFNETVTGQRIGIEPPEPIKIKPPPKKPAIDWIKKYQDLIIAANIPRMSDNGRGDKYQINAATKPGRLAYKKAIEDGQTDEELLAALKVYYSSPRSYQIKVEKFFVDEVWRGQTNNPINSTNIERPNWG
jgi:hypothetical protein